MHGGPTGTGDHGCGELKSNALSLKAKEVGLSGSAIAAGVVASFSVKRGAPTPLVLSAPASERARTAVVRQRRHGRDALGTGPLTRGCAAVPVWQVRAPASPAPRRHAAGFSRDRPAPRARPPPTNDRPGGPGADEASEPAGAKEEKALFRSQSSPLSGAG